MKSEFYREIGEFEKARDLLKTTEVKNDFQKNIVTRIQEKINQKDCKVFIITE